MNTRKFKINRDSILELLNRVNTISDVLVDLPDTKETYKTLADLDWDFADDEEKIQKIEVTETEEKQEFTLDNFNELATYVEAVFRLGKKSPALIFKSKTWKDEVEKLYTIVGHEPTTIEHSLTSSLLSSFYGQFFTPQYIENKEEIINDLDNRLEKTWKEIQNHPSMASYLKILLQNR